MHFLAKLCFHLRSLNAHTVAMPHHLNIVHNPTTTLLHDQLKAKEHAESEKRRSEQDARRAIAKANPEQAKLYSHSLGGIGTHAAVVVKIPHKDGSTVSFMTCELSVDADGLTLIIVCPSCLFRHGRKMDQAQLTIRSWHRNFTLDAHGRGELWVNPENPSETVMLAGTIETHGPVSCPDCHFRFELEKSRLATEKGVTVIREV